MPSNLTEVVTALTSTSVAPGGSFSFSARASNIGTTSTGAASTSRIFLSMDPFITGDDTVLQIQAVPTLAAGTEFAQNYIVNLPGNLAPGTYYVGGLADYNQQIGESNEGDNNFNVITLTVTPPNLTEVVTALTSTTVPAGTSFSFATNTVNLGRAAAPGSTARIFISPDPIITAQDTLLATHVSGPLNAGTGSAQNFAVTLPANLAPGTWYIGGLADYYNQVGESNEGDNNGNILTITVAPPPAPNLTEVVSALTSTTVTPGGMFSFAATAANSGNAAAAASTSRVFLSSDPIITGADTVLAIQSVGSLAAGATFASNYQVQLPGNLAPGTYYIGGLADFNQQVGESNEGDNNNNLIALTVLPSNLTETVTALTSTSLPAGGSFSFSARASNSGTGNSFGSTAGIYLSTDPTITTSDTLLTTQGVPILTPGGTFASNFTVNLPGNLAPGTYYIGGVADILGQVPESNEGDNNNNYIAITITAPNLTANVQALTSTTVSPGGTFSFASQTANIGNGNAVGSTTRIYLSTDPTITTSDTLLATQSVPPIGPGLTIANNYSVTLPSNLTPGATYYVGAIADVLGQVGESNESDNVGTIVALTVPQTSFNINFNYSGDPSYLQYFTAAANRWSQVVTGDLPDVNSAQYGFIDDLLIQVNIAPIDGVGGVLGQAGPDARRSGTTGLPYHGTMTFDSADVPNMVANGTFGSVVLHEMGHILGIGSLWDAFGFRSGSSYFGANGVNAYRQLAGNNSLNSVPLETTGGAGTANVHWSEAVFNTELMTGYSEASGVATPLSILTIGGLQDLGYQVNYGAADPYSLLVAGSQVAGGGEVNTSTTSLQEEGGRDVVLTMDEANSQLSEGIAGTFGVMASCPADPAVYSAGIGEAVPTVATPPPMTLTQIKTAEGLGWAI